MKKICAIALTTLVLGVNSMGASAAVRMRLAHALAENHPTSQALKLFKEKVEKDSKGSVKIQLFFNGSLGSEPDVVQQLRNGAVEITKVNASTLENFDPVFKAFALPFLFTGKDNFYQVMEGPIAEGIYSSTKRNGYISLTFYDSGARSFYTKNKPINTPDDLKGQKLRVMDSQTAIRMVHLMGGIPTPMPYGEIYAALQQGVIDGAENNVTALTLGRHGEVTKFYSLDEHSMIPDFLVISTKAWEKLTPEQQGILRKAARESTAYHKGLWKTAEEDAMKTAVEKMGVTIVRPEKKAFIDKVKPIYDEYTGDAVIGELVKKIRATQK
ncbi:TRAP transporter substrate-binding protein [Uliginosibacterium sp. sgz301328]|uniref:TRAP transporter substrate-binding protein n=1 Tax=Uliginosibacterium sp. sgz301328 TaxID=3243764 RepID=UPI00359ECC52